MRICDKCKWNESDSEREADMEVVFKQNDDEKVVDLCQDCFFTTYEALTKENFMEV